MAHEYEDLRGRVAMVTGAGSGLGKAAARLLAQAGVKVGLLSHTEEQLQKVQQEIGGETLVLAADVAYPEQMQTAYKKLLDTWGRLDIVYANAGINGVWAPLEELTPDDWDKTLDTNLKGTFLTVKYAVPHMKERGGSIIITSSINGTRVFSNTGATAYSSSKAGQVAFAKMTALELAQHKIRVNVICPGWIESQIDENTQKEDIQQVKEKVAYPEGKVPLTNGKPGKPEQVGQLVMFLASDASSHITGSEIWIDGAESLLVG